MILDSVNIADLEEYLAPHLYGPVWPALEDPLVKERARDYARQSGLWEELGMELKRSNEPIPIFRRSLYRDFHRTGCRQRYEAAYRERSLKTGRAALALWLEHPAADLDFLQDLIWAWCESSWQLPAHDNLHIELASSLIGATLAELTWLFRDRIEKQVQERVSREVHERMLDIALDWRKYDWWQTTGSNWNIVCNSHLIQAALYEIRDAKKLAAFLHPVCRRLDYALRYFTPDGGCVEGASYWEYGFGAFLDAALVLRERTGGKVNLAAGEHLERICRFPMAVQLRGEQRATFGDCRNGYLQAQTALKINRFFAMPELFRLVEQLPSQLLRMEDMRSLALYKGEHVDAQEDRTDYFLPDLGYAKVHAGANVILAAAGGRNDVSHNHNDLGTFVLMHGETVVLTDPGAPVYSAKTFSHHRYEMLFCRSRGHSVPVVNGREQQAGPDHFSTMEVSGFNTPDAKTIHIDLSKAYDDPSLERLVREFYIDPSGEIHITDRYEFSHTPLSLEEAFVTFEEAAVVRDGKTVEIGRDPVLLLLQTSVPGNFAIDEFPAEMHEGQDLRTLRRITFTPHALERNFQLVFICSPFGR